ncbi:ricin-type beta-trefoil lectin domain protein [Micromonospora sp. NPDC003197]
MSRPKRPALRASWRTALAAITLVVVASAGTTVVLASLGDAEKAPLPGVTVPAEHLRPITEAATSCPTLTPARLAGQLMEESRFVADATTARTGRGLAGLTDDEWRTWQPWPGVDQVDAEASVLALAHYLCHLMGQVREVKVGGEPWPLAVAAYHSGMPAVLSAGGVPDDASDYVNRIERYAAWYALNTTFSDPSLLAAGPPGATTTTSPRAGSTPSPQASSSPSNSRSATPTPTRSATPTTPPGFALVNDEYHGCVSAVRAQDGTHLRVMKCDGSSVQRWETRSDGTIRSVGLCMDVANASTDSWTPVQVAWCSGNPAQQFRINSKKQVYSPFANKCLNVHILDKQITVLMYGCLDQGNQYFRQQR